MESKSAICAVATNLPEIFCDITQRYFQITVGTLIEGYFFRCKTTAKKIWLKQTNTL